MSEERTTETLRCILFDAIDQVRDGKMSPANAKNIAALADRIIKTAELELKHVDMAAKHQKLDLRSEPLLLTSGNN